MYTTPWKPFGIMVMCKLLDNHPSHSMWLLLIFIVASSIDISTPLPVPGNQDMVELTLLEEVWNSDHRARRDADSNLPDRLTFAIPVAGDRAVIRMTRSRLLPVIMSDEESTRDANSFSQDAGVFTNLSSSSSVIVRRQSGTYMLRGTFVHQDVAWTIQSVSRHKRDVGNVNSILHLISPLVASNMAVEIVDHGQVSTTLQPAGESEPNEENTLQLAGESEPNEENTLQPDGESEPNEENNTLQSSGEDIENEPGLEKPTQHVVEIAFIVDYADYNKWVTYVGLENAPREMRLWYTFVAQSINIRYQNIKDPDIAISTTVTVLRILNEANNANLYSNRFNNSILIGEVELENLQNWHLTQTELPLSDHYMLFTGLNLISDQHGDIYGNAFMGTLCTEASVSIVENDFNENVGHTCAHELAHSMSADHDESEEIQCSPNQLYVMSSLGKIPVDVSKEGNNWIFSPCSVATFKSYLSNVTCTLEITSQKPALPAPSPGEGEGVGMVLSLDDQCRLSCQNRDSYFCQGEQLSTGSMAAVCRGVLCSIPNSPTCQYILPQEYTPCGDNQWCRSGKCTSKYKSTEAQPLQNFAELTEGNREEEAAEELTKKWHQHVTDVTRDREEQEEARDDVLTTSPKQIIKVTAERVEGAEEVDREDTTSITNTTKPIDSIEAVRPSSSSPPPAAGPCQHPIGSSSQNISGSTSGTFNLATTSPSISNPSVLVSPVTAIVSVSLGLLFSFCNFCKVFE